MTTPPKQHTCIRCNGTVTIDADEALAVVCAKCAATFAFIGYRREGRKGRGITDGRTWVYWLDKNGHYIRDPKPPGFADRRYWKPRRSRIRPLDEGVRNSPKNRELHLARKRVREDLAAKGGALSSALHRTFDAMDAAELAAEERAQQELRKHGL